MKNAALTELHRLLDGMRAWANTALTGYNEPANRHVACWDVAMDAQGGVDHQTLFAFPRVLPESAHGRLAIEAAAQDFGAKLVDIVVRAGLLDVGLRTMRVSVSASSQPFKHLVSLSHSGVLLWPMDKAMGTDKAMAYLREAQALLGMVAMDAYAPRTLYEVDRYRVAAPDPRSAVVLHLVQHDPKRLRRVLERGPLSGGMRLPVHQLVTENGENLFATLNT